MRGRGIASVLRVVAGLLPVMASLNAASAADTVGDRPSPLSVSQRNYLLGCGGCHGVDGVSNSTLVPALRDQVGYFLNNQAGREYLVRLPNVAFSTASDHELADMLNFVVFQLGGASVPTGARPYAPAEVARLRKQPLTEISLVDYRKRLIDSLSAHHKAPGGLSEYGSDTSAAAVNSPTK
jgi:mono/diheme cytochrome c family protein